MLVKHGKARSCLPAVYIDGSNAPHKNADFLGIVDPIALPIFLGRGTGELLEISRPFFVCSLYGERLVLTKYMLIIIQVLVAITYG